MTNIRQKCNLGTGHYLYPGLGPKRNYFERKKFIYPTINNRKFSNTPPFISLKNNYPTKVKTNTFVIYSKLEIERLWCFKISFTQPLLYLIFSLPNPLRQDFFSYPTIFSSAPTLGINNDRSLILTNFMTKQLCDFM